jgi:hypothetical protein
MHPAYRAPRLPLLRDAGQCAFSPQSCFQPAERAAAAAQEAEAIYGRDLMTPNEIAEHRAQMQAAKTAEERERIRAEHHSRMRQRAKERGVEIPETPPRTGQGHGPGPGAGHGGQGAGGPKR